RNLVQRLVSLGQDRVLGIRIHVAEISALMSGSQVQQPSYVNTPTTQLPTVDQAGMINENFNQKMGLYDRQVAQSNATMGG
ncbi:hypothetical protein AB9E28_35495, partial [Rhizobium leguminosarum]